MKSIFKKKREKGKLLKILPANGAGKNIADNDCLRLINISTPKELDEYVLLHSSIYEKIFDIKKKDTSRSNKQLSIVKVCFNGKCVHRAYLYVPATNFNGNCVALTPNSINELSCEKELVPSGEVVVSKGCRWMFYWYHPNAAVRMSFRIGLLGIFIAILLFTVDKLLPMLNVGF